MDAAKLDGRDQAFARLLTLTSLRRLGRIDRVLEGFLDRPLPKRAGTARAILRAGAAQLLFLDGPPYAVVDAMTGLAGARADARAFKGLVNAVLRRVADGGAARLAPMSAFDDWPSWLTKSWRRAYGARRAQAIAEASGTPAPLDLTLRGDDADAWIERLGAEASPTGGARLAGGGPVAALPGYAEGAWWVQDAAAALPARLLSAKAGERVLDLCAAPGGKTMQLAAAGADVTAVERGADRAERLEENLARTRLAAAVHVGDAEDLDGFKDFDAVLLDAPCTATGTLRRRPDVAWSKAPRDARALGAVFTRLITAAAGALRPGGRLVVCTCSLQPEEGRVALDAAIADGAPLAVDPIAPQELGALADAARSDGVVRTFPFHRQEDGGVDGFFIARLARA